MKKSTQQQRKKSGRLLPALLLAAAFLAAVPAEDASARQQTIFVNHAATGQNDGTTWEHAYTALQDAIAASSPGDAIWIAAGTYRPDEGQNQTPGDRAATFLISHDLSLFGGFAGTEAALEDRNPEEHETILSGDLLGNDGIVFDPQSAFREDNVEHVVLLASEQSDAFHIQIDRVVIQDGHAIGEVSIGLDRFSEIIFKARGGGIYVASNGEMTLSSSTLTYNRARACGGGIFALGRLTIIDSHVKDNNAGSITEGGGCRSVNGAGIYVESDEQQFDLRLYISGSTFAENTGGDACGGGLAVNTAHAQIVSSSFTKNISRLGSGLCFRGGRRMDMSHVIIRENIGFEGDVRSFGNGVYLEGDVTVVLSHVLLVKNGGDVHASYGGGIYLDQKASVHLINSVVADNKSEEGSGIMIGPVLARLILQNSIISKNDIMLTPNSIGSIADVFAEYTIINGVIPNESILGSGVQQGVDPLLDENYHLLPGSPAVDAGANVIVPADTFDIDMDGDTEEQVPLDLGGNPRFVMQDGSAQNRTVDLGPFEMPFVATSTAEYVQTEIWNCGIKAVYPKPATSDLIVELSAPGRITLVNLLGRRVATWNVLPAGRGQLSLNTLPRGMYFLRYENNLDDFHCSFPLVLS